jgi:AraC-like DNA-binding protein
VDARLLSSIVVLVSILNVRGVIAEVRRLGLASESLLRCVQLEEAQLADTRIKVPAAQVEQLIDEAMRLTGRPDLGLSIGAAAPEFQLMSHFAQALPTLRDAIAMLQRYAPIFLQSLRIRLTEDTREACFQFDLGSEVSTLCERFFAEVFSMHCVRIAQRFFTDGVAPLAVCYRHAAPSYAETYGAIFGCPVHFLRPDCAISFDVATLDAPQPNADLFMANLLRDACERLLGESGQLESCVERVRHALARRPDLCDLDTERVAQELGVSPRSLRTQLAEEGLTFSGLVEEARIKAAAEELLRPGVTIKEAGARLGYSEVSAFHRAFKRWMNITPGEYVRQRRGLPE